MTVPEWIQNRCRILPDFNGFHCVSLHRAYAREFAPEMELSEFNRELTKLDLIDRWRNGTTKICVKPVGDPHGLFSCSETCTKMVQKV